MKDTKPQGHAFTQANKAATNMSPPAVTCCLELTPVRRRPTMKGAVPYVRHPVKAVAVHNGPTGTWPLVPKGGRTEA